MAASFSVWRHFKKKFNRNFTCSACSLCHKVKIDLCGKDFFLKKSDKAKLADGQAEVQYGDTSVLVTAVGNNAGINPSSFVPLRVVYRQKASASGRIPINHMRRELGPTEKEILIGRMIDRSLRPLLKGLKYETELTCNVLAVDGENLPDVLAINAASASLALSNIPCLSDNAIGAVRVGLCQKENVFLVNPTRLQLEKSSLNMVVAASTAHIVMVDASADCIPKEKFFDAVKFGVRHAKLLASAIESLRNEAGKEKPTDLAETFFLPAEYDSVYREYSQSILNVLHDKTHDKMSRQNAIDSIRREAVGKFPGNHADLLFNEVFRDVFRKDLFDREIRCDGRSLTRLRDITCSVDVYKPLHGSALFQRGQTQVLCTVTFDSKELALKENDFGSRSEKEFMLHYEFPSYATNELSGDSSFTAKRRSIGHGALAEKALNPLVPKDFPFVIRLTSEVLESNGSSSMASVCGGSMALMDAGVQLPEAAAGVAVGLVTKDPSAEDHIAYKYVLLADITGLEDGVGDMDFKIAGTQTGITALQMDIKIKGLHLKIMKEAIDLGVSSYHKVLKKMNLAISEPRSERKPNAPITDTLHITKKGRFVQHAGWLMRKIRMATGVYLESNGDGSYKVFAPNQTAYEEAKAMIDECMEAETEPELEFGAVYKGKIVEINDGGVNIQLHPTLKPYFVPCSQLDIRRVDHPSALGFEIGQEISVKYFGRDANSGQPRLSRKVLYATSSKMFDFLSDEKGK